MSKHVREAGDRLVFSRRRPGFRSLDALPPELARLSGDPDEGPPWRQPVTRRRPRDGDV